MLEVTSFEDCLSAFRHKDLKQSLYDEAALMMEKALVNLHGMEHRKRRTQETKVFKKNYFHYYEKTNLPKTLNDTIGPFIKAGKADLIDLGYRVMMNLTCDFTGIDRPLNTSDETSDLLRLLREFSLAPALGQSNLEDINPLKARIRAAMKEFDENYFTPSLERRSRLLKQVQDGKLDEADLPRDALTVLLQGEKELGYARKDLLQEGIFFTLAGAHTSIHSVSHSMHNIFKWIQSNPEEASQLKTDPFFIQRCVFESLRLEPSSPVAKRRSLCPVTLEGHDTVPQGDEVVINIKTANSDESMFGERANEFNPHRVMPSRQSPYGLSMGYGMHACLGRNLAIGVVPKATSDPETHQYGTVPLILEALLRKGAMPDPDREPVLDKTVKRHMWSEYPIIFNTEGALL